MGMPSSYSGGWGGGWSGVTTSTPGSSYSFGGWGRSSSGSSPSSTGSSSSSSSGSSSSSSGSYSWISPTERAEQTVRSGRKASNQGIKGNDVATANEPVNSGESENSTLSLDSGVEFSKDTPTEVNNTSKATDYSFITDGKNNENRYSLDTKSAVEKQNEALETLSRVHDRNWYSNDQVNDINMARGMLGLPNMKGTMAGEGVNKDELKNKQIEVSNRLSELNNPEISKLRNDIRNVANVLDNNENIVLTDNSFKLGNAEAKKDFSIGEKIGKNFRDVEKNYMEAFKNYEEAKALKDADKEKEAKEVLDTAKNAMREQIALEKKVANETINEFIEMVNKPDVPGLGRGVAKSAISFDNTKVGDMTVHVTKSDADENAVNVSFVAPDGREVDIGQVSTEGYNGSFMNESLTSRRDAFKSQIDLTEKTYEKRLSETPATTSTVETSSEETSKPISIPANSYEAVIQEIDDIDVSKIESKEQAEEANVKLSQTVEKLGIEANNYFETLVSDMTKAGKSLEDIRNSPEWKSQVNKLFEYSQKVYDKTSAVEEYSNRYLGDVDISSKRAIKQNLREVSDKIAEMQGAKRIVHTDDKGNMSIVLNSKEIKALADYGKSIESTKDAAIALMKSAAFNGAQDIEGEFYSTAWKNAKSLDESDDTNVRNYIKESAQDFAANLFGTKDSGKFNLGDCIATGSKGLIGFIAMGAGAAMMPVNPVVGSMLMFAGLHSAGKSAITLGTDVSRSRSTNAEVMFRNSSEKGKNVWNDIYNRSNEEANFGDPKSVKTYTAAAQILGGFLELTSGDVVGALDAFSRIKDGVTTLSKGGLTNNTDRLITNVFALGNNIVEWGELNPDVMNGMTGKVASSNKEDKLVVNSGSGSGVKGGSEVKGGYGLAKGGSNLSSSYSGYREQAKDSNLAKDYNAGMEEEVKEAVSDKYTKIFKVMIDKEPDYIRKVLIAIPKNHCEREWE